VAAVHRIEGLIDCSAWTGRWPFLDLRFRELPALKDKLLSVGVTKAFVAPIEAILERDPFRANRELLGKTPSGDGFFSPVVVLDLSFPNWRDSVELAAADGRVRMVKLLPNYHLYTLDRARAAALTELTRRYGMVVSVQMRMEDTRGMYPALRIGDVAVHEIISAAYAFPEQPFVLSNIQMHEIPSVLTSAPNIHFDISSVETQDVMEVVHRSYGLDRFLFASHTPFYYPEGTVNKLKHSALSPEALAPVVRGNAEKLFGL